MSAQATRSLLESLREGGGCHPEQVYRASLELRRIEARQKRDAALLADCLRELEDNYDLRLYGELVECHPELRGLRKLIARVRKAVATPEPRTDG